MLKFVICCEGRSYFFFTFSILSNMAHFVILEKRSSNYEISMISLHHMLWAIRLFCQKCSILSFFERPVYFFHFFNLSKTVHFVSFEKWTSNYEISMIYLHHMLWPIRLFCQKCSILSFSERPVYFFTFQYCHQRPILSLWKSGIHIMR